MKSFLHLFENNYKLYIFNKYSPTIKMIKLGFLMNLTFLLCIMITQLLIWVLDGTLLKAIINLLNIRKMYDGFELSKSQQTDLINHMES